MVYIGYPWLGFHGVPWHSMVYPVYGFAYPWYGFYGLPWFGSPFYGYHGHPGLVCQPLN